MRRPALDGFTIFGHRGAAGSAPENTLAGFDAALGHGARWIELDVQAHPEALVVFHDDRLERRTDGSGALLETPLATLRALDAGDGTAIPMLEEVLDHLRGRAALNIELKGGHAVGERTAAALDAALAGGWRAADLLVSSFDHAALAAFRAALPQVPVAPLFADDAAPAIATARRFDTDVVHLARDLATAEMMAELDAAGLRAHVYTVNDPEEAERLRKLGASGIFTDYPGRFMLHT